MGDPRAVKPKPGGHENYSERNGGDYANEYDPDPGGGAESQTHCIQRRTILFAAIVAEAVMDQVLRTGNGLGVT